MEMLLYSPPAHRAAFKDQWSGQLAWQLQSCRRSLMTQWSGSVRQAVMSLCACVCACVRIHGCVSIRECVCVCAWELASRWQKSMRTKSIKMWIRMSQEMLVFGDHYHPAALLDQVTDQVWRFCLITTLMDVSNTKQFMQNHSQRGDIFFSCVLLNIARTFLNGCLCFISLQGNLSCICERLWPEICVGSCASLVFPVFLLCFWSVLQLWCAVRRNRKKGVKG